VTGHLHKQSGYPREPDEWYVDEPWVSALLFAAMPRLLGVLPDPSLAPVIVDPCCGTGHIPMVAQAFGHRAVAMDLRDRGLWPLDRCGDFRAMTDLPHGLTRQADFVMNPPYGQAVMALAFIRHALTLARRFVCAVVTESFLSSAERYHPFTAELPLAHVWVLSSRPSMPPGGQGIPPKGGQPNYHWHIYDRRHPIGKPWTGGHLIRDGVAA
jgi:hypothetical protein